MRLTSDQRHALVDAVRRGLDINVVAEVFNTSIKTARFWVKRAHHRGNESYKDKPRKPRREKVTLEVELSILGMRNSFDWGTARIQQGLFNLPPYMRLVLPYCAQKVVLSRTTINEVLKKHGLNGYKNKFKSWKFFRAKEPNELWQLDPKGPVTIQGKKHWFVVCIDDFSRYMLLSEHIDHEPTCEDIEKMIIPLVKKYKPKNILTDNKPFKEDWDNWCRKNGIEPLHAHPYYPQDKGKVERAIRNLAEEFVNLLRRFPEWLKGKVEDYRRWFNLRRFHRGVKEYPIKLFKGKLET